MLLKEKLANGFFKAENMILNSDNFSCATCNRGTFTQKRLGDIYMWQQYEHRGFFLNYKEPTDSSIYVWYCIYFKYIFILHFTVLDSLLINIIHKNK